jgi:hypothetical protein
MMIWAIQGSELQLLVCNVGLAMPHWTTLNTWQSLSQKSFRFLHIRGSPENLDYFWLEIASFKTLHC